MKKHLIILNPSAAKGSAIGKNLRLKNSCRNLELTSHWLSRRNRERQ